MLIPALCLTKRQKPERSNEKKEKKEVDIWTLAEVEGEIKERGERTRCSNASREYLVSGYLSLELMFLTEQLHYKHEQPRDEDV